MPPAGNPHEPSWPSPTSPIWWWAITNAVPGDRGPAHVPITPDTESTPSICGDSKKSSSRSATLIENSRVTSATPRTPRPLSFHASCACSSRSFGRVLPSRGGTAVSSGPRTSASPCSHSSQRSIASASARGELGDLGVATRRVGGQLQRAPVGVGDEVGTLRVHLVAVALEVEVAQDRRRQQAHHVGEHRDLVLRSPRLLGDGGAADDVAALEHDGALAGAGEVGRGDEPVVAAADDDGVVPIAAVGRHRVTLTADHSS